MGFGRASNLELANRRVHRLEVEAEHRNGNATNGGRLQKVAASGLHRGIIPLGTLPFTLLGSRFSVRVQVRFRVPCSSFGVPLRGSGFGAPCRQR